MNHPRSNGRGEPDSLRFQPDDYEGVVVNSRGCSGYQSCDGGYGVYELIHENLFFPVGTDISLTDATMLLDIMGTNAHGISRAQLVRSDIEAVVIAGAGPIGLGMLAMVKIMLGKNVPC